MADWPLRGDAQSYEQLGFDSANSRGTAVACGLNDAKGSWVTLGTTGPSESVVMIAVSGASGAAFAYLFDIGIGATPVVVLENLHLTADRTPNQPFLLPMWFRVPANTVIKARGQSSSGSARTLYIYVIASAASWLSAEPFQVADSYGVVTATSDLTVIDPGATIHTKGGWTEIAASTTRLHRGLFYVLDNRGNTARTTCTWSFDVSIGAAASEKIIIPDIPVTCDNAGDQVYPTTCGVIPVHVPEGTRLAVRSQCSINEATDRLFGIGLYGVS